MAKEKIALHPQEKNAARIAAVRQKAVEMKAQQASRPLPINSVARIPQGASPAMAALLTTRTHTQNERAKIHHQTLTATPEERQQAIHAWQQQHQAEIADQVALAKTIREETPVTERVIPSTPHIPAQASSELRTFLTLRHTLMKEQTELVESTKSATPAQQRQALENWQTENSTRFQTLRDTAIQLSQTPESN